MERRLSFAFFQFLSQDPAFQPVKPERVLEGVYGGPLLKALYPAAVGRYFRQLVRECAAPSRIRADDRERFGCTDETLLTRAFERTGELLGEWASAVAREAVENADVDPWSRILISPAQRILCNPEATGEGYRPLSEYRRDYELLVQLLGMFLAARFPSAQQLTDLNVAPGGDEAYSTLKVGAPESGTPVYIALIPGFWLDEPCTVFRRWLKKYVSHRKGNGLSCRGHFVFFYSGWLTRAQLKRLLRGTDWSEYEEMDSVEIWCAGGIYRREGRNGVDQEPA